MPQSSCRVADVILTLNVIIIVLELECLNIGLFLRLAGRAPKSLDSCFRTRKGIVLTRNNSITFAELKLFSPVVWNPSWLSQSPGGKK